MATTLVLCIAVARRGAIVTFDRFAWHRQFRGVKMPPAAARAAMALFDRADQTGQCWPGIDTLAADTGLTDTGVRNGIKWLEANGFVEKVARGGRSGDGKARSTRYRLKFATTSGAAPSSATPVAIEDGLSTATTRPLNRNDTPSSTATPVAPNRPENRPGGRGGGSRHPHPPSRFTRWRTKRLLSGAFATRCRGVRSLLPRVAQA